MDIVNAEKPLIEFFQTIGKSYSTCANKLKIIEKMHFYLLSLDDYKIAIESDEQILRTIAVIICHCSPIIYIRVRN